MIVVSDLSEKFRLQTARVCKSSPFGAYIESYMNSYGDRRYSFVEFWLHFENDRPDSAFCRYYDTLIFCGEGSIEAEDFVRMLSPQTLLCSASCGFSFDGMEKHSGELMQLTNKSTVSDKLPDGFKAAELTGDMYSLKEVYSLLCSSFSRNNESDFETFFIDNSHKIRHSSAQMYAVYDESGSIASTLSVSALSSSAAVIGSIATKDDLRRNGIAGAMLTHISQSIESNGKEVFLMRRENIKLYEKCGFSVVGAWEEWEKR